MTSAVSKLLGHTISATENIKATAEVLRRVYQYETKLFELVLLNLEFDEVTLEQSRVWSFCEFC